jgi:microcystin-dependent protein
MAADVVNVTVGNEGFGIMQPYLSVSYLIALRDTFPSRS